MTFTRCRRIGCWYCLAVLNRMIQVHCSRCFLLGTFQIIFKSLPSVSCVLEPDLNRSIDEISKVAYEDFAYKETCKITRSQQPGCDMSDGLASGYNKIILVVLLGDNNRNKNCLSLVT